MSAISDILLALTSKQTWYSKIFDDAIVEKWREEAKDKDDFELALRILRTTAQGCVHLVPPMCDYNVQERERSVNGTPSVAKSVSLISWKKGRLTIIQYTGTSLTKSLSRI